MDIVLPTRWSPSPANFDLKNGRSADLYWQAIFRAGRAYRARVDADLVRPRGPRGWSDANINLPGDRASGSRAVPVADLALRPAYPQDHPDAWDAGALASPATPPDARLRRGTLLEL